MLSWDAMMDAALKVAGYHAKAVSPHGVLESPTISLKATLQVDVANALEAMESIGETRRSMSMCADTRACVRWRSRCAATSLIASFSTGQQASLRARWCEGPRGLAVGRPGAPPMGRHQSRWTG